MLTPNQPDAHARLPSRDEQIRSLPLAALLWKLSWERVSGVLVLQRHDVRRMIYLRDGTPFLAGSNGPREGLGRFLIDRELCDRTRMDPQAVLAIEDPADLVSALDAAHAVRPNVLAAAVAEHVRSVLRQAFRQPPLERALIAVAPDVPDVLQPFAVHGNPVALVRDGVEAMDL